VSSSGIYTLKVPLTKKTRATIKAKRRVKLTYTVSLTPPFAKHVSVKATRTLGK
jgi:hypothetical protein